MPVRGHDTDTPSLSRKKKNKGKRNWQNSRIFFTPERLSFGANGAPLGQLLCLGLLDCELETEVQGVGVNSTRCTGVATSWHIAVKSFADSEQSPCPLHFFFPHSACAMLVSSAAHLPATVGSCLVKSDMCILFALLPPSPTCGSLSVVFRALCFANVSPYIRFSSMANTKLVDTSAL